MRSELRSCERIGGLKCGQPGVEIGCVDLCGNRQPLFDLAIYLWEASVVLVSWLSRVG
jgi:hypothetical protein